jgi:hypothetical protein
MESRLKEDDGYQKYNYCTINLFALDDLSYQYNSIRMAGSSSMIILRRIRGNDIMEKGMFLNVPT